MQSTSGYFNKIEGLKLFSYNLTTRCQLRFQTSYTTSRHIVLSICQISQHLNLHFLLCDRKRAFRWYFCGHPACSWRFMINFAHHLLILDKPFPTSLPSPISAAPSSSDILDELFPMSLPSPTSIAPYCSDDVLDQPFVISWPSPVSSPESNIFLDSTIFTPPPSSVV